MQLRRNRKKQNVKEALLTVIDSKRLKVMFLKLK